MKQALILAALLIQAAAFGQIKMAMTSEGRPLGTASLIQKLAADGSKTLELSMSFAIRGQKGTIRMLSTYDREGRATRKFQQLKAPHTVRQVTVAFPKSGASVVIEEGGRRRTEQVPLVETANRKDATEFWFIRDMPKPGTRSQSYEFNVDSLKWEFATTTYQGRKAVRVSGRIVQAHVVVSERTGRKLTAYFDEKGMPYLLQDERMKMERIFENEH